MERTKPIPFIRTNNPVSDYARNRFIASVLGYNGDIPTKIDDGFVHGTKKPIKFRKYKDKSMEIIGNDLPNIF